MAIQSVKYWQWYGSYRGGRSAGSWSAVDRLVAAVTAIRDRSSPRSLAWASQFLPGSGGGAGASTPNQGYEVVEVQGAGGVDVGVAVGAVPLATGRLEASVLLQSDERLGLQGLAADNVAQSCR